MEVKVTYTKTISRCYGQCPYFDLDGGPGPVMICTHPETIKKFKKSNDLNDAYIISHPKCDNGFPEKCPLIKDK